jgi:hypothetical protein
MHRKGVVPHASFNIFPSHRRGAETGSLVYADVQSHPELPDLDSRSMA